MSNGFHGWQWMAMDGNGWETIVNFSVQELWNLLVIAGFAD